MHKLLSVDCLLFYIDHAHAIKTLRLRLTFLLQIDQHEADAHYDRTVVKRREEEARLEAERKYEHR